MSSETDSSYFFGNNQHHLRHYASFRENAERPRMVGISKPNDFGLFDMSGNVAEWCQDLAETGPNVAATGSLVVDDQVQRVVRGGSYADAATELLSSSRSSESPERRRTTVGFRVARTYP